MPVDLNRYRKEVESGLSNESAQMDLAAERQDFYDFKGTHWARHFRRDAENTWDFQGRSKRASGFLRGCVEKLCGHMYTPGPSRRWVGQSGNAEPAQDHETPGAKLLQKVYQDNLIDSLMLRAEQLCTLNNVCAIQIDAGSATDENGDPVSDFDKKPITYRIWAREQFCVWTDPNYACTPIVVCIKDMYDTQKRYRLFSDTEVWEFRTKKQSPGFFGGQATAGGTAPYPVTPAPIPHDYGCLPFTFIHYELPLQDFEVVAVGDFLWKAEINIDDRLMRVDEAINKHINPIPIAEGTPEGWKPIVQPMRFIRLPGPEMVPTDNGFQTGEKSDMRFVQAQIDVGGAWDDLDKYLKLARETVDCDTAYSEEQVALATGIAMMLKQEPLLKRAEKRRAIFKVYEEDLAKRTLTCVGNHYGKQEYAVETNQGHLVCGWPAPRLAILTQDVMDLSIEKIQNGYSSHLMEIENLLGMDRDQALEYMEQIKIDTEEAAKLMPDAVAATAPADPEAQKQHELALIAAKQNGGSNS